MAVRTKRNQRKQNKSVVISEVAIVAVMALIVGFLGFTYVNNQQKLANNGPSSSNTTPAKQSPAKPITAQDVAPIATAKDLPKATDDLDRVQEEWNTTEGDEATLVNDLNAIAG